MDYALAPEGPLSPCTPASTAQAASVPVGASSAVLDNNSKEEEISLSKQGNEEKLYITP